MNIRNLMCCATLLLAAQAQAEVAAGKALVTRGAVNAISAESTDTRKLKRRSPIYSNDVVSTGDNAKAQLRMTDGGMIALKENSELIIADYKFSDDNGRGSVAMELIKGGLRSVTGSIKAESGDYKLKTPVGSIGIRGTHYEVEIVGDTIWVAVWDGAVDLDITSGAQAGDTLSLGQAEGFSYASIDNQGKITTYIEPPQTFETGMTSAADDIDRVEEEEEEEEATSSNSSTVATTSLSLQITAEGENTEAESESDAVSDEETEQVAQEEADLDQSQQDATTYASDLDSNADEVLDAAIDEVFNTVEMSDIEESLIERTGEYTYNQVSEYQVDSSAGNVTNFQIAMTIDFGRSSIPEGNMSFEDSDGEWFATFDGLIEADQMDLDITYASHGDNLADGDINSFFYGEIETIIGDFTLEEIVNPGNRVTGSFIIK